MLESKAEGTKGETRKSLMHALGVKPSNLLQDLLSLQVNRDSFSTQAQQTFRCLICIQKRVCARQHQAGWEPLNCESQGPSGATGLIASQPYVLFHSYSAFLSNWLLPRFWSPRNLLIFLINSGFPEFFFFFHLSLCYIKFHPVPAMELKR